MRPALLAIGLAGAGDTRGSPADHTDDAADSAAPAQCDPSSWIHDKYYDGTHAKIAAIHSAAECCAECASLPPSWGAVGSWYWHAGADCVCMRPGGWWNGARRTKVFNGSVSGLLPNCSAIAGANRSSCGDPARNASGTCAARAGAGCCWDAYDNWCYEERSPQPSDLIEWVMERDLPQSIAPGGAGAMAVRYGVKAASPSEFRGGNVTMSFWHGGEVVGIPEDCSVDALQNMQCALPPLARGEWGPSWAWNVSVPDAAPNASRVGYSICGGASGAWTERPMLVGRAVVCDAPGAGARPRAPAPARPSAASAPEPVETTAAAPSRAAWVTRTGGGHPGEHAYACEPPPSRVMDNPYWDIVSSGLPLWATPGENVRFNWTAGVTTASYHAASHVDLTATFWFGGVVSNVWTTGGANCSVDNATQRLTCDICGRLAPGEWAPSVGWEVSVPAAEPAPRQHWGLPLAFNAGGSDGCPPCAHGPEMLGMAHSSSYPH